MDDVNAQDGGSGGAVRPAGMLSPNEAAALLGVNVATWYVWESAGKVPPAQWVARPRGGGRAKFYPAEAVERLRREQAQGAFPPPGTVDVDGAAAMLGISTRTFSVWVAEGRVTGGRGVSVLGRPGRSKVYPVADLERLKAEMETRYDPYPDPQRPGAWRVPIVSGKHAGMAAVVDEADLPLVRGRRWNWSPGRADGSNGGSVVLSGGGGTPLARMVMGVDDPALLVSHANGDRLDFRRENLVVRTRSEARRASKRPAKWDRVGEPYPDPDRPGVVRVPVATEKHAGMEALIDAADAALVRGKQWNWSPGQPGDRKVGSVVLRINGSPKPSLSRVVMGVTDPAMLVSHLNGDRLDCRRENMVLRTRKQVRRAARKMAAKAGRACSSRFKGVHRTESDRKWSATIAIDGQTRQLGRFRSEVDAALAYDAALRELMGPEVVGLNLPDPAEAERLRALEPPVEDNAVWPPPGMVDRHEACAMFGVSIGAWMAWERKGRITCGRFYPLPDDSQGGRCKLYPKDELERARVEIEKLGKPYPHPDRPGVWRVPLKGYVAYREALIDAEDLPTVAGRNWNWSERTDGRVEGTVVLATTARQEPLHRLIAGVTDPAVRVMFLNGDALDCRRANLAVRTLAETNHTSRKMSGVAGKPCSSRFKGVCQDEKRGRWVAQIGKDGVHLHVGRYRDELAAAQAYDDCARVMFGPHAYVNFPDRESSEQDRLWAQRVLDGTAEKERQRRRQLKALERKLKRAVLEARRAVAAGGGSTAGRVRRWKRRPRWSGGALRASCSASRGARGGGGGGSAGSRTP